MQRSRQLIRTSLISALAILLAACNQTPYDQTSYPLAMNQVQYLGTHNSYKGPIRADLFEALLGLIPDTAPTLDYSHAPLQEQLTSLGIRQIELDVFDDPQGGHYANRQALKFFGENPASGISDLEKPGLKVMHIQEIDYESSCYTFVACLRELKAWSEANPGHLPVTVLVEAKDGLLEDPLKLGFAVPFPFDGAALDRIDQEILSVFRRDTLITPDWVRGDRQTLEEAILQIGWPTLDQARGRIMFALDNQGATRDTYLEGHHSLKGRVMFTDSEPGTPEAAFIKQNDPADFARIQTLVQRGYMVRTRADANTAQARANDYSRSETALQSGAQFISTDYPAPDTRFGTYVVRIPGGAIARCNPINAPARCRDQDL